MNEKKTPSTTAIQTIFRIFMPHGSIEEQFGIFDNNLSKAN
jgi:hypothetical protein